MKVSHWVEDLTEKLISSRAEPYVVNSGMTTSGSPHMGTVCEFLYPSIIYEHLKKKDYEAKFFFEIDIMDAFDNIPFYLEKYRKFLEPHLGKPLCQVPDPFGNYSSYGERFFQESIEVIEKLDIEMPTILKAQDLYGEGRYDSYAILFFKEFSTVKDIIERTSMRKLSKDWSPIMPICSACNKIATTRVTSFNVETAQYEYICDKEMGYTRGCGHQGRGAIKDHKYKLVWRLDWPARQDFLHASIEGSGVDHMTKGGSWDTAKEIHEKIFNKQPPIPYRYGFIMLEGKKYSKSKGQGFTVNELLTIIPKEVLKYALLRPDIEENIDFKGDALFLINLIDEYSNAAELLEKIENKELDFLQLKRHEQKKVAAVKISKVYKFSLPLTELFMYKQLYGDWATIQKTLNTKINPQDIYYVENWFSKNLVPDEYTFSYRPIKPSNEIIKEFFESLDENMDSLAVHNKVFEFAREKNIEPKELFKHLYLHLIGKEKGPKLGKLITTIGIPKLKNDLLNAV